MRWELSASEGHRATDLYAKPKNSEDLIVDGLRATAPGLLRRNQQALPLLAPGTCCLVNASIVWGVPGTE